MYYARIVAKILVMVLAGGEGKRLAPLTNDRAKPAVPFAGNFRLIDFALVLGFVGLKMMLIDVVKIPVPVSLGVVALIGIGFTAMGWRRIGRPKGHRRTA